MIRALVLLTLVLQVMQVLAAPPSKAKVKPAPMASTFSGLVLRTHPDEGVDGNGQARVLLLNADVILMDDGSVTSNWGQLTADVMASGAGGLDTGVVVGDSWYETYAIRKSSDGTRNLMFHRRKNYALDQSQMSGLSFVGLRDMSGRERLAQSFATTSAGKVEIVDVPLKRVGTPTGRVWFTIETDSSGAPSGIALATSDKITALGTAGGITNAASAPGFNVRAIFRNPMSSTPGVKYWLVLHGDYPIDGASFIQWYTGGCDCYAGAPASFNGSAWGAGTDDYAFKVYVTNEAPVVMPSGYDQKALLGFFYTNHEAPFRFDPMIFNGRKATWLIEPTGGGFVNFTNTSPVIQDANIIFPHGLPVLVDILVTANVPTHVMVAGLPEGYMRLPGRYDNATSAFIGFPDQYVFAQSVSTEYGGLYVSTGAGIGQVMLPRWEW